MVGREAGGQRGSISGVNAADVEIIRDVDGVAHIRAADRRGAFFGQGYAAAEDRLWQFVLDRLRATGRLAEVVGPAGVVSDTFHRRMGLSAAAAADLDGLRPPTKAVFEAYADGVNAFLASGAGRPPELELLDHEPEPWEPWHSIAVFKVRHLGMGTYEGKVWRSGLLRHLGTDALARLWPEIPEITIDPGDGVVEAWVDVAGALAGAEAALGYAETSPASNNLAVAGRRTASGSPIVAGDPHRAIDLPNVYWQNHVRCPDLDVIGLSFPGVPGFPHFGHNAEVAWCITHGMADDQDVYVETLREDDGGVEYRHDGTWRSAEVRQEQVAVAGGEPVEVSCVSTHHGPVVARYGDVGLALRWTALAGPDTTYDALVPMLEASSVDELDAAMAPWVVPVNSLLMADRSGTIAYRMRGRLAQRATDNGWTAVPGDDPARDWTGFVADEDLPRWRDPASGVLVTANNRISSRGPYVSHDYAHPARAARLGARLAQRHDWTTGSIGALLGDTHSVVAVAFAERLLLVPPTHPLDARAQALLLDWDHHMDAGSAAAAVYGSCRAELVTLVSHELGLVADRLPGVAGPSVHQTLRFVNSRLAFWIDDPALVSDAAVATALRFGVRRLQLTQGEDPTAWRWGRAHTARFVHPLAALRPDLADQLAVPPPVELGGDNECVWATSTAPPSTEASNAPVARYVFDLGDWERSAWIVPNGVSGDARSSHHLDQLDRWRNLELLPMRYSTDAVDAATASVTTISTNERPPLGQRPVGFRT